jgi:YesN/AraC family two-component response regulator
MDGIEMFRRIKNDIRTSHVPVVMLTATADISSRLSGIEKGADAYLLIPFDEIELQAVLKNLIGLKRKHQEHYVSVTLSEIKDRTEPGLDGHFMQKVLYLMDANIDDDQFGIAEICDTLGMSRAQIYRKFKSFTDRTPHDYLRTYRLQRAKELLLTTKINVSGVAYRTGFKNISHFSRIFAEEFGKNPSKFCR